jgi:hypothetical protein
MKELDSDVVTNTVKFVINELTRSNEFVPNAQKSSKEILCLIGNENCTMVMDELTGILQSHQIPHFMVIETLGSLTRAKLYDAVSYIKNILQIIIPMLSLIKQDYQKKSYAFAIQNFCDAIIEHQSNIDRASSTASLLSNEPDVTASENDEDELTEESIKIVSMKAIDISSEIGIIYDVIMQQWINTRDVKLISDLLIVVSYIFQLLPVTKVLENTAKIIQTLLMMYKRSIDRSSITIFLNSVIHTTSRLDGKKLEVQIDSIIMTIFDLICANPDFEKPVAVRSHNEVLRCYDLIAKHYGEKVNEMIIVKFKANDERDKIKALILLTHLTITNESVVQLKVSDYLIILRQMIMSEKSFKNKQILLRAINALSQKGFIQQKVFIKFIIHHCCRLVKIQAEQGSVDEENELIQACTNTLMILSKTFIHNGFEGLLKEEILQSYMMYEYTSAATTFVKCLTVLFQKDNDMRSINCNRNSFDENDDTSSLSQPDTPPLPSSESIFVRSLVLMANFEDKERIKSILHFLLQFCENLSGKHLQVLWSKQIDNLLDVLKINDDDKFYKDLNIFIMETIRDIDDIKFSESLVNKMSDQFVLYAPSNHTANMMHPSNQHQLNTEVIVPNLRLENGLLMKIMGLCLCYVTDIPSIETKIDLIINHVKNEKLLEKNVSFLELEEKFIDPANSIGLITKSHYDLVMKKFESIFLDDTTKKSGSFFANLKFTTDSHKEAEKYRMKILIIFALNFAVNITPASNITKSVEDNHNDKIFEFLNRMLAEMKECQIKKLILSTLLKITDLFIAEEKNFKYTNEYLSSILNIPMENVMGNSSVNYGNFGFYDYLPLYPYILKLATNLIQLSPNENKNLEGINLLDISSRHFFAAAQNLNIDDETKQSYLAPHINSSIPELNTFIKVLLSNNSTPAGLDDVSSIFEKWMKDKNSQVRICAALIMEQTYITYIKTMKIGLEAPSKFHQTGNLLGKIVPRCIDSNAKVRETSVNILKKILELAYIYETLTIPDNTMEWVKELKAIRDKIIAGDNEEIISLAEKIAFIIALRLPNQQYVTFSKALLYNLNDPDLNSSAGSALVLNFFIKIKGSEIFHAIFDLVRDSFYALNLSIDNISTRTNIYHSLVSLTKFHPKLVCAEILLQPLPFDENVCEFWHSITADSDLTGIVIENFLEIIYEMSPYETSSLNSSSNNINDSEKAVKTLAHHPFAVICAFKEIIFSKDLSSKGELKKRFPSIFSMLLTTLAAFVNTIPPPHPPTQSGTVDKIKVSSSGNKTNSKRFGFSQNNRTDVKPSQLVMDTFIKLMDVLENENVKTVLESFAPQMSSSTSLNQLMEFVPSLAISIANSFNVNSSEMKEIINDMSKYNSSTCDAHRIALIGFYSQLIPLKPCGDVSKTIMLHLTSSLSDPSSNVRGFAIRGLAFVSELNRNDLEKYSELALTALFKGIDDFNATSFIDIPLESLRGLSRLIETIPKEKLELFELSLTIRIRTFFDSQLTEVREAAILLFGNICQQTKLHGVNGQISESLREQLITNIFVFLLHLNENEPIIVRVGLLNFYYFLMIRNNYFS